MDLGISGRTAVVCASTQGLGRACATELARAGCTVVVNGRSPESTEKAAADIAAETGATVVPVAGDLNEEAVQDRLVAAVDQVDILVNNNGGPPFRDFREIDREALLTGVVSNMATPIRLIQGVVDGMVERRFGRIVNITSSSVKMPIAGLDLSSGARIGLTGFMAGVARSVAHANVTVNFLLPGRFATGRLHSLYEKEARDRGITVEQAAEAASADVPAGRPGDPAEFGAACAFLCSAQAGYITGQSLLMDGGAYPGVL
ncbi:SDR family oxidoreductase [Pseudonocardia ailaonensis]|uniref:SDR family oxidoreductase n=1 Tax=Pseudonocardia ailaonensis TaxID=367279 RepID=A0ABN2MW16_9PSEU